MIQVAIVEDDKNYADKLKKYLIRYEEESGQHFQITWYQDGEDIVENYKADYDIILMDIEMRFMDGMTTAEEIRKSDSEVVIIFITNAPQYAMKGYSVTALDYVLKPVNYFAFSQRIERALKRMNHRQTKSINVSYKGKVKKVDVRNILYVEVRDHNLYFHTNEGEICQRGTMKEIEKTLADEPFFRCDKGYLINLDYVKGVDNNNVQVGEKQLSVSRARKKDLLDALNNHINEVSK